MKYFFVESEGFQKRVYDYLNEEEYANFQQDLIRNPKQGVPMQGCGGLRKARIETSKRGKGKRGGGRVIYLHVPEAEVFFLFTIYGKNEKDDLTTEAKKKAKKFAAEFKAWAKEMYGKR
jgi:hypothetical protein